MKKLMLPLLILVFTTLSAQEKEVKDIPSSSAFLRGYVFYPIQFGHHSLAEAHDPNVGFGVSLAFVRYKEFRLSAGFEAVKYKVTDFTKVGNIKNSNYNSVYAAISYDIPIGKKFCIYPDLGYGYVNVYQKSGSQNFGHQNGNEYRVGIVGNYRIDRTVSFFAGAHFIHTALDINTNPEYEKFFGQAEQIQICLGIQIK